MGSSCTVHDGWLSLLRCRGPKIRPVRLCSALSGSLIWTLDPGAARRPVSVAVAGYSGLMGGRCRLGILFGGCMAAGGVGVVRCVVSDWEVIGGVLGVRVGVPLGTERMPACGVASIGMCLLSSLV